MKFVRNDFKKQRQKSKKRRLAAIAAALACVAVVGASYYRMSMQGSPSKEFASQTEVRENAKKEIKAASAGKRHESKSEDSEDTRQASAVMNANRPEQTAVPKGNEVKKGKKKTEVTVKPARTKAKETMTAPVKKTFDEEAGLTWPVKGNVLMKFSENNTIYFKTLAQYKNNPAIEISADEGTKVIASAAGTVKEVAADDIYGTKVITEIGSGYTVTYGQLKEVKVSQGDEIKEGELLGRVAKPTKYFSQEGGNLYFQVKKDGKAVDPLLLLN